MTSHPLFPTILSLPLLAIAVAACGDSSSTGGGGSSSSSTTPPVVPELHRAKAEACTAPRPDSTTASGPGACAIDADCTSGVNGRCVQEIGELSVCSYD